MPRRLRGAQARAPVGEVCSSMGFCTWGRISALSAVSRRECERLSEPSGSCNVRMKIRGSVSGPFCTSGEPPINVSENQCSWGGGSPGPTVASSGWQVNELADYWRRSDGGAWSHRLLSAIMLFCCPATGTVSGIGLVKIGRPPESHSDGLVSRPTGNPARWRSVLIVPQRSGAALHECERV